MRLGTERAVPPTIGSTGAHIGANVAQVISRQRRTDVAFTSRDLTEASRRE